MLAAPIEIETLVCCPICQEKKSRPVLSQPDGYIPLLQLNQCDNCQIVYLNPRLTFDSMVAVEDESEVYIFSPDRVEEYIVNPMTGLISWLQTYVTTNDRRLLDIGCNRGLLMEAARRQGWQTVGVEISPEAVKRAREEYHLAVYSVLDEIPLDQQFDLVAAWHVLEHTRDPVAFLRQAASHLRPGGILAIQVPSFDYLEEFRRRQQLVGLLCAVHNFYFTKATLQVLLDKVGLRVLHLGNEPKSLLLTAICTTALTKPTWQQRVRRVLRFT